MKKNSTRTKKSKSDRNAPRQTIGLDLGDRNSRFCRLGADGRILEESSVPTQATAIQKVFGAMRRCRIALEVGTHSPWVSRLLTELGHEVIVANPRQVALIGASSRKNDRMDAQALARLARVDPQLLQPIRHRSREAQEDLMVIRVRATLVEARTSLVNAARGLTKALGKRLPQCDADQMSMEKAASLPGALQESLRPLLEEVASLTEKIHALDAQIEQIARDQYPETALLTQVHGVGTLIALTFVLTIDDKQRFAKSRDVGCYLGLRPQQRASGARDPQLRISKEGDVYLRKLLVQGAHCILRRRAPDTDLQRWGLRLCARGGKNARKRAVVAVARKLAILLHRLWVTGEVYEPSRQQAVAA